MLAPPSDVNWLLSALAQASAAMIAIIGGLLVSRYVALHSEQQAARRRLSDLQRRSIEAGDRLASARAELALFYIDDVVLDSRMYRALLDNDLHLSVRDALDAVSDDGDGLDVELLEKRLVELADELRTALGSISPLVPESLEHETWQEFRRENRLEIGQREVWEWAYEEFCRYRRAQAQKAEAQKRSPLAGALAGMDRSFMWNIGSVPDLRGIRPVIESQHEVARVSALRARVDSAEADVRALDQEQRLAGETLEATRQPEGFGLALQVLTTLAVLGMGIPVIVMGTEVVSLPWMARAAVILAFALGVALLLRFLFVYASFLREGGRRDLPASALGLLKRGSKSVGNPDDTTSASGTE